PPVLERGADLIIVHAPSSPHRLECGHNLTVPRARKPAENFPADAYCEDRTLRKAVQDRCEDRAGARITLALLFSDRGDANNRPTKTSREEILPRCLAIHQCPLAEVGSVTPGHLALVRVQSPRSCHGRACQSLGETPRAASSGGLRPEHQIHRPV